MIDWVVIVYLLCTLYAASPWESRHIHEYKTIVNPSHMVQYSMKKGWRYELDLKPHVWGLTQSNFSIFRVSILYLSTTKMYFFWCPSISQLCHRLFDKISVKGELAEWKKSFCVRTQGENLLSSPPFDRLVCSPLPRHYPTIIVICFSFEMKHSCKWLATQIWNVWQNKCEIRGKKNIKC